MKKRSPLHIKALYTAVIVLLYLLGRNLPIFWVQTEENTETAFGIAAFVSSMLGTEEKTNSLFALGLMPWITASIIFQLFQSARRSDRGRVSPKQTRMRTLLFAIMIAVLQAYFRCMSMQFKSNGNLSLLRFLTTAVLVSGSLLVILLAETNKKRGIGGQSVLILINILSGLNRSLASAGMEALLRARMNLSIEPGVPFIAAMGPIVIIVTILFDRSEIRLPLERAAINSSLSGEDYLAVKLHPVGTMPAMYVMTLFSLPYFLLRIIDHFYPGHIIIRILMQNLNLTSYMGICVLLLLLGLLTIALSMILVNPTDISTDLQKNGDYIEGICSGEDTKRYIRHTVLFASCISALTLVALTGIPLVYRVWADSTSQLFMLPMTLMILTGILLNVIEEVQVERLFATYKPFI